MHPYWILRHHSPSCIRSLHYAAGWLAVGDEKGQVSLVDLHILRPRWKWTAHSDSLLTVHVISKDEMLTHARDNELKLWRLPPTQASIGAAHSDETQPELVRTIGVNALNFSRCSYRDGKVAVPNALDAAYIDVLDLHTGIRTHEAIGRPDIKLAAGNRLPIVMSLHLLADSVVAGYEDGYIKRWKLDGQLQWSSRGHSESVMSTSISSQSDLLVSVSADDRIARLSLSTGTAQLSLTKTPGKASIELARDACTFAVGQWNGRIKVYAVEGMEELGELAYHRDTVECLAFAHAKLQDGDDESDSDDEQQQMETGTEWVLAAGGRDGKVSLWKYH